MKKFDLEDRFIDYTLRISNVVDEIDNPICRYNEN